MVTGGTIVVRTLWQGKRAPGAKLHALLKQHYDIMEHSSKLLWENAERPHSCTLDKCLPICHTQDVFNACWRMQMTAHAHLAELNEKHRMLERRIEEELARPAADNSKIRQWKREKLKLKDEIAKLSPTRH